MEISSWRLNTAPITVIPTCVDLDLFNPDRIEKADQAKLREKLGIKNDDFVLLYLGSWGTWYLTNEMLDFFSEVKKQKTNAKFLIVSGDDIDLKDYNYKHDVIITSSPRHLVPLYISLVSVSVVFIKPSFSKKASSATKMGEITAMNIPLVTNGKWGDVELFFNERSTGYYLNNFSDQSYEECLSWLKNEFVESRTKASRFFDLKLGVDKYLHVYKDLIKVE